MPTVCPFCQHEGPPLVNQQISMAGWIVFVVLLFACLPICWLPFVLDSFKEDVRTCASCGTKWG